MLAINALSEAHRGATKGWTVVMPTDPESHGGQHIEIHDEFGRTATVHGVPDEPETRATADLMALAQMHMLDLLSAAKALYTMHSAYLNDPMGSGDTIKDVLRSENVASLLTKLTLGMSSDGQEFGLPTLRTGALRELKSDGLTIGECITTFSVPNTDPYVVAARKQVLSDDDTEIDDNTVTAPGDGGAFVLAWLWIGNEEAGVETNRTTTPAPRYVYGDWNHFFRVGQTAETVRFCFDTETNRISAMSIYEQSGWRQGNQVEIADVEDSLRNANGDAIECPADYGLEQSNNPQFVEHAVVAIATKA